MNIFKKVLIIIVLLFIINIPLIIYSRNSVTTILSNPNQIKVAVFIYDFADDFLSEISQSLEEIEKRNQNNIKFTFYDGKSNQAIQNQSIDNVLNEGVDLILLNLVVRKDAKIVIDKIKQTNTPVILFNREPFNSADIQSYDKALYIGTDGRQAGELQGKMLADTWNTSKQYIDKNHDNIMQYIMLEGEVDNWEAIKRTQFSVSSINGAGIKTQQISLEVCNWLENCAYNAIIRDVYKFNNNIEVIISNDDTMAIGAIKALQRFGFNNGILEKTIPVVGVDVTPDAKQLIEKGFMLGSVYQSPSEYAEALYTCGMNMVQGKDPTDGTKYRYDNTGVSIRLPQTRYLYRNIYINEATGTIKE